MSNLIPNYDVKELLRLDPQQWSQLKSAEIWNGEHSIGFFIFPNTSYVRAQAERFALLSNTVGGSEMASLLPAIEDSTQNFHCDICDRSFKAQIGLISHKRTHKKEGVLV